MTCGETDKNNKTKQINGGTDAIIKVFLVTLPLQLSNGPVA